jgi:hypothetical protein
MALARSAWHNDFKALYPTSVLRIGRTRLNEGDDMPDSPLLSPNRDNIAWHQQFLFVFHDHLRAFLSQTNFSWFLRTTEDVFVHLKRLPLLIRELEEKFDPRKDIVMQGQVVELSPPAFFIHGGAGWIMSRAAAEFYVGHIGEINRTFLEQIHGDDTMPMIFRDMTRVSSAKMVNDRFVGPPLDEDAQMRLRKSNYTGLRICPSVELQRRLSRWTFFLNRTTIWHAGSNDMVVVTDGYRILAEVPPWVRLGHIQYAVTLCRADVPLGPRTDAPPFDH